MPTTAAARTARKPATKPGADLRPIRRAAEKMKQAGEPTRLRIMLLLLDGELCVGDICAAVAQSQPAVSHHLVLMRHGQIVESERRGKNNVYSLTPVGADLARAAQGMMG